MATHIISDRITDTVHAIVEHCLAHGDEPLPQGVLAHATRDQLDHVANMLDAGGFHAIPVIYGAWFGVPTARQPCKCREVAEIHIGPGQQRSWSFFVWVADNRCIRFRYPGIDTEFSLLRHRRPLGNRRS
ncbi:MAG: hypothetical protein WAO08_32180 [Hyphomicrobiaceae bacterium]